ncbi:hypothetical protein [Zhihengliuella halotolerans]|uniref:hypothetical protein n=1 Tax=Zhihengliuella halotolerans TaxID=370736 RepID=UPI00102B3365|nr:hypothetical protein [Zhihengliuella halotolerans]
MQEQAFPHLAHRSKPFARQRSPPQTSQIDSQNEALMQRALSAVGPETTQLIVAHRLATIVDSDQIIVMRDGVVEDVGTHAELLGKNEFYLETARQQLLLVGISSEDVDLEVQRS